MKEIEVKAKVADFGELIQKLAELGCAISEPISQHDLLFANPKFRFNKLHPEAVFLRIRNQNGAYIFTVKQSITNELDSIEHETEIQNPKEMEAIIEMLGYRKTVEVKKNRRKANYGNYEICLDEVEELGKFVEVEKMTEEDGTSVQKELFAFLESLGIPQENRVLRGYDSLMYEKLNETE